MSGAGASVAAAEAGSARQPRVAVEGAKAGANRDHPAVLLSRTTMNQNARNALCSLVEHGMLAEFWTTFVWRPRSVWNRILPGRWQSQLARRSIPEAPPERVRSVPWREAARLAVRGTVVENWLCSGERPFSSFGIGTHFDRRVARRLRKIRPGMVYAYDGAAVQTLREAKKLGITAVYELTSAYWRMEHKLFAEEAERNPEFAGLLGTLTDPAPYLERKEQELRLADYIIVPSAHVRESLRGVVAEEKIRVIAYGAPPIRDQQRVARAANRPLKVLFAGSLIQRKGISYVLEAVEMLGSHVELTLVGARICPNSKVDAACRRWRWFATLPHERVMELMQESDVLLLPSLTEAFGLVVTEALACGLPAIVTPNTGAGEIMRDSREGYIVPICRADVIAGRLESLHRDRDLLAEMSHQAQLTAANNSWEHYRVHWAGLVRSLA
jgi:alpha-maltose-1-phosphate synthase